MARKVGSKKQKNGEAPEGDAPQADEAQAVDSKSNVPDEVVLEHYKAITDAKDALETAQADYRNARKRAKLQGVSLSEYDFAVRLKKMDETQRKSFMTIADRYAKILRVETGTQFGLFQDTLDDLSKNYDDGFFAGREAKLNLDDNPHALNTKAGQEWARGYHDGQVKNAEGIQPTVQPEAQPTVQ